MAAKANTAEAAIRLEDIPNVGASIADDLRGIDVYEPSQLVGRDPYQLYAAVCARSGELHDPCLCDTFIAAVRFMEGGPKVPWYAYTAERKQKLGMK